MRLLTLAVAALAALLLTIALANAQEPPESQTAARLEPGVNLVGWTGEPTSTSQLFDEIPQLESIWAWDAELDDWIIAGRGAPEWLGGLGRVWAGTGLRLVLGGEEPFLWQRSTEPTSGLVKLRTGWNLVAWSGADGAPIEQVAKGIGWSLRELRRWDAANQQWTTWTSPERSAQLIAASAADQGATDEETEPVTVRRGEALWVNTARSINWLQPTDILPRLVFPGGASDELQARVREDLESVLAFYGQQYGIQAEPDFTVYIPKDVEALIQAQKDDGYEIDAAHIRAQWNLHGGWGGEEIMVKQTLWPGGLPTSEIARARYVLTHEYFHVLQGQLSHRGASQWLVEGTATWAAGDHQVIDGLHTWEGAREGTLSNITEDTPSLRSTESNNAAWQYTLGWLATDRLTEAAGGGSYIEFWRRLAPTEIGSHHRWTSTPGWRAAFQETFGLPTSSFYADFDAWQQEQAAANRANANPTESDARWIRGRVTRESGAPVAGVFVNAIRVEGEISVGWNQRAETGVDGTFAVRAPEDGDYRISVDIAADCTRFYSNGDLTEERDEAQPVSVNGANAQGVDIQLPQNICGWLISGRVVDADDEPLANALISICETTTHNCVWNKPTKRDGAFAVLAPTAGEYRLSLELVSKGCIVHYRSSEPTPDESEATPIRIADSDVNGLRLQVPSELCNQRIVGSIEGIERFLDFGGRAWVQICQVDTGCSLGEIRDLDRDGPFAIAVSTPGSYRLNYRLNNDCFLYHGSTGLTSNAAEAVRFDAGDRDVRIHHRRVPAGQCSQQISGRLVNADGEPPAQIHTSICQLVGDDCAIWLPVRTDADGSFAVTGLAAGAYRLNFKLNGCSIYYRAGSLTTRQADASRINVTGAESSNLQLRVPEGMCARRIAGRFVDANGAPLVVKWIYAIGDAADNSAASSVGQTDADGSFEIGVSSDDAYHFAIALRSQPYCSVNLEGRTLGSRNNPVRVRGADVTGITLRLPGTVEELCG